MCFRWSTMMRLWVVCNRSDDKCGCFHKITFMQEKTRKCWLHFGDQLSVWFDFKAARSVSRLACRERERSGEGHKRDKNDHADVTPGERTGFQFVRSKHKSHRLPVADHYDCQQGQTTMELNLPVRKRRRRWLSLLHRKPANSSLRCRESALASSPETKRWSRVSILLHIHFVAQEKGKKSAWLTLTSRNVRVESKPNRSVISSSSSIAALPFFFFSWTLHRYRTVICEKKCSTCELQRKVLKHNMTVSFWF